MTAQNMKEEFNKDMESLKKQNQTKNWEIKGSSLSRIKNTIESHSSRMEQVENKISGFEDKLDIKGKKTEEFLDK
jgi:predicted  nucleic acid-binding Zn-ribbon protein